MGKGKAVGSSKASPRASPRAKTKVAVHQLPLLLFWLLLHLSRAFIHLSNAFINHVQLSGPWVHVGGAVHHQIVHKDKAPKGVSNGSMTNKNGDVW